MDEELTLEEIFPGVLVSYGVMIELWVAIEDTSDHDPGVLPSAPNGVTITWYKDNSCDVCENDTFISNSEKLA